jgi:hypothetical protein
MDSLPCTLIIPAAGDSVRFQDRTTVPKGIIRFAWRGRYSTMIGHIVPYGWDGRVMVGVKNADVDFFTERLPRSYQIIGMEPTTGQAETVRNMALDIPACDSEDDVLIVNSDNGFDPGVLENFMRYCRDEEACCGALVFNPNGNLERYGYVDGCPNFTHGAEKSPISKYALAGAFYFRSPGIIIRHGVSLSGYISDWFLDMPKPKRSFLIPAHALHEWGTSELLEKDADRVDWEGTP